MEILFNFKMKYIEERSSVINPIEDYKLLLKSKKKLRVKLGVDPTAPDVTLGWYSVIRALKKFQEYGHDVILILGEFTAKVEIHQVNLKQEIYLMMIVLMKIPMGFCQ